MSTTNAISRHSTRICGGLVAVALAAAQADAFGKIYPRNARPTQALYERDVLSSK
jgi:carbonic anhydrase